MRGAHNETSAEKSDVPGISVIVPVLNEGTTINEFLNHLTSCDLFGQCEVIVVDGDDEGSTIREIQTPVALKLRSPAGRSIQMNSGARRARGKILLFLHADTYLPRGAFKRIIETLDGTSPGAGAFDLGFASPKWRYRIISFFATCRSRITKIPFGDQAIFISRELFERVGGFTEIPLMEDIDLMRKIKRSGAPVRFVNERVMTSPRKWETEGAVVTTLRNYMIQALYWLGVDPRKLHRLYYRRKNDGPARSQEGRQSRGKHRKKMKLLTNIFRRNPDALLFFVKFWGTEPVKTRLSCVIGNERAAELYRNFMLDMMDAFSEVDMKLYIFCSGRRARPGMKKQLGNGPAYRQQRGDDLGQRMHNALRYAFRRGHRRVLLVGSDIPEINPDIINEAYRELERKDAVIGPSDDGGYYLIGYRAGGLDRGDFEGISWSTGSVFRETMKKITAGGRRVHVLPELSDIDTVYDLRRYFERAVRDPVTHGRTVDYLLNAKGGI